MFQIGGDVTHDTLPFLIILESFKFALVQENWSIQISLPQVSSEKDIWGEVPSSVFSVVQNIFYTLNEKKFFGCCQQYKWLLILLEIKDSQTNPHQQPI